MSVEEIVLNQAPAVLALWLVIRYELRALKERVTRLEERNETAR